MNYSLFARYYDSFMAGCQMRWVDDLWVPLIARAVPDAKRVLELGCGTGSVLLRFERMDCTGIDCCPEMLSVARRKVPSARLIEGDIRKFSLNERFDVVLCVFDTLNHLLSWEDWLSCLDSVAAHLAPGGIFCFDINTLPRLLELADYPAIEKRIGNAHVTMKVERAGEGISFGLCMRKRGLFRCEEERESVSEVSFDLSRLVPALWERWSDVRVFDESVCPPSSKADRVFITCRSGSRS